MGVCFKRCIHMGLIKNLTIILLTLVIALSGGSANAAGREGKRPKVALVLSGGGARGLAHVGVIKVLEKYGITVDYVVGTSMGSIVGGYYASGYDAPTLEKIALSIDWEKCLDDRISRRELSYTEKRDEERFLLSLPYRTGEVPEVSGIIEGIRLHAFLNRTLMHVQHIKNFSSLPIPFACVATDIYTGEAVVLDRGHLPTALRASMGIPSIFTPVKIDGRLLVDGGLVLNFPVSVARSMGADIVIGVDVGTPLYRKDEALTIPKIIDQITSFKGADSTKKQRELCDILITPDLEGFTSSDFDKTAEFIRKGEQAALLHSDELKSLADEQDKYVITKRKPEEQPDPDGKICISRLRIEGLDRVSKQLLNNHLQLEIPSCLALDEIERAVSRAYGSRFFKTVTYRVERKGEENILIVMVEETSTDYFNIGVRYDSDLKAAVLLNTEFKNFIGEGSRVDVEGRLSENPAFRVDYYSGIGWPVGFGFGSDFWFEKIDVFSYYNNDISGEYNFITYGGDVFFNLVLYHNLAMGIGLKKEFMRIDSIISMEKISDKTVDYLNPYLFVHLDTIDRSSFTRSGIIFDGEAMYISNNLSVSGTKDAGFQRYYFNTGIYVPLHSRVTFLLTHFLGMNKGDDIPLVYSFAIGGMNSFQRIIVPFVGLDYMEAYGTNIHVAGTGLQLELFRNFFIMPRGNVARIASSPRGVFTTDLDTLYGYGMTAGYLSYIGPVQVTVSRGSNHTFHFHFNIGFVF